MSHKQQYFVFMLDDQRYGMDLHQVERVIPAVELIGLPEAPEIMSGLINLRGRIIPVVDIRKKFRLPHREMDVDDRIIIFQTATWTTAFIVDKVEGVMEFDDEELNGADQLFPEMERYVEGVGKVNNESVLIYDIDSLFSMQDISKVNTQLPTSNQLKST